MVNSKIKKANLRLFSSLNQVIAIAEEKYKKEKASNSTRQSWGRLLVSAISTYGKLLENYTLQELEERISTLEKFKIEVK